MKTIITFSLFIASMIVTGLAYAGGYDDVAIIKRVSAIQGDQQGQQQVCDQQTASPAPAPRSMQGSIIGGIVGGLLGNQVGGGNGRLVATAIGAVGGSITGDRVDNRNSGSVQQVTSCRWVQVVSTRVTGYAVTFEYNGRTMQTVMQYDPSNNGNISAMRIGVSVQPL